MEGDPVTMAYEPISGATDTAIDPEALEDPESSQSSAEEEASNLLPLPLYDPYSWRDTFFVINGRPFTSPDTREPLFATWAIGTALVVLSGFVGLVGDEGGRTCRAWCSQFSLGPQPHSYIGVILFLLMAFRSNQSYKSFNAGLTAWTRTREHILTFTAVLLNTAPEDALNREQRVRLLAFASAYPYALSAELAMTRTFPERTVKRFMSGKDLRLLQSASSMPMFCIDEMMRIVNQQCVGMSGGTLKLLNKSALSLIGTYTQTTRIRDNPVAFIYIAHLRFLLIVYLCALPLALVESLGWSTVPVFYVISYALLSLEVIAVELQNPFNNEKNDLRLHDFNFEISDMVGEMYRRWLREQSRADISREELHEYSEKLKTRYSASDVRYALW